MFVANEEEKDRYQEELGDRCSLVVGKFGIGPQRTFINGYFAAGTKIVCTDDDAEFIIKSTNRIKPLDEPIIPLVQRAFDVCDEFGAKVWSITPSKNGFFMQHRCVHGLRGVNGEMYGEYAGDPDTQSNLFEFEDTEKGIKNYLKYGGTIRIDDLGIKQKRYAEGGCVQSQGSLEKRQENFWVAAQYLVDKYPDCVAFKKNPGLKKGLFQLKRKPMVIKPSILTSAQALLLEPNEV